MIVYTQSQHLMLSFSIQRRRSAPCGKATRVEIAGKPEGGGQSHCVKLATDGTVEVNQSKSVNFAVNLPSHPGMSLFFSVFSI